MENKLCNVAMMPKGISQNRTAVGMIALAVLASFALFGGADAAQIGTALAELLGDLLGVGDGFPTEEAGAVIDYLLGELGLF